MGILQARILEWVAMPSSRGSFHPRDRTEPPGKPKNIGVGSLSLLQGIFLTQESNQGLLHYRQILYQLSYQGSPRYKRWFMGKESACNAEDQEDAGSIPGSGRSSEGGNDNPLQYSCLKKSHGQRSLVGYSPKCHKELDTTEQLSKQANYKCSFPFYQT